MFLKFFLTHEDSNTSKGWSIGNTLLVSTHNDHKKELYETTNFHNVLSNLAFHMKSTNVHTVDKDYRVFLINVSDEAMFQLEMLYIPENSFCTYNILTGKIGFGDSERNAILASLDEKNGMSLSGWVKNDNKNSLFFDFNVTSTKLIDMDEYQLTVPDTFYDQVLNELRPYICQEKIHLLKVFGQYVLYNKTALNNYLDLYFENLNSSGSEKKEIEIQYCQLTRIQMVLAIKLFMEDDKDFILYKDEFPDEYYSIGELCRKIMNVSGETF
ncbi:hypothetical protein [Yersinia phage fHe-Yen9-04]|uniref:Uncharacterized protein n=1 Tax=Yersinia phage fHe-Yen9-04 TaxID=2052742 RepID=A0A2C9CX07_9CAUD|nr:hypothetical protein FDJ41_gp046 [Yersinia phage fHe-Yen9-04]SOK58323.1 hypothetical protein [Yersinia phage fHe-Yen9-04]VUE36092.1 hypothetical protein [Yersinia phage fHe-Yen9-04]